MLVDDSITSGFDLVASSAPGDNGGTISLLDLPLETDGLEAKSIALLLSLVSGEGGGGYTLTSPMFNSAGEMMYIGSSTLDEQRRHALTWIGGEGPDGAQGLWEFIPDATRSQYYRIRHAGQGEYLYVGSSRKITKQSGNNLRSHSRFLR